MKILCGIYLACALMCVVSGARRKRKMKDDCPVNSGAIEDSCPLLIGKSGRQKCFKMFSSERGSAFTLTTAKRKCAGLGGHLANVPNRATFKKVRCYIRDSTTLSRRDPKVLLGMKYDTTTRQVRLAPSGRVTSNIYWGGQPLSYGSNMVLRATKTFSQSRILNFGGSTTRYDRILCEYPHK